MREESVTLMAPKISKTCEKCKHGVILAPYLTTCAKYPEGKPYDVYFGGKECPMFVLAKKFIKK